jgi:hypothetical protein
MVETMVETLIKFLLNMAKNNTGLE